MYNKNEYNNKEGVLIWQKQKRHQQQLRKKQLQLKIQQKNLHRKQQLKVLKKPSTKVATKTTTEKKAPKTSTTKKATVKRNDNISNADQSFKLSKDAMFNVWVDALILVFIVLMFVLILYGYVMSV